MTVLDFNFFIGFSIVSLVGTFITIQLIIKNAEKKITLETNGCVEK